MIKLGWHTWEPGLSGNLVTSAGGAAWTSYLFHKFEQAGIGVYWCGSWPHPDGTLMAEDLSKLDAIVLCWRWPMPDRPERQLAYERQCEIIETAIVHKIPLIIHDQDHKMTEDDVFNLSLSGMMGVLTAPELFPKPAFRTLMFPNPYPINASYASKRPIMMTYVGNNYERFDQAVNFLGPLSDVSNVFAYGNWMDRGAGRESPEEVSRRLPHVVFEGRLSQVRVLDKLSNANFTVHLFKKSYGPTGFVTMRWAEAAAASTPAFIPADFKLPTQLFYDFSPMVVHNGRNLRDVALGMNDDQRYRAAIAQRQFVRTFMRTDPWIDLVKEVAR